MTYLIDTHILMWFVENSPKLSNSVRLILENTANTVMVSHVSFWEITIKKSIGKLEFTPTQQTLERKLLAQFIEVLSFETKHCEVLSDLPFHHQDPFDRMLIAQAIAGDFTIITQDRRFKTYEPQVKILWN